MTVRICVIGVGRMGANHVRCLSEMPEAELLAIADANSDRVQELAEKFGCRSYSNHRAMLLEEKPDAVVIAVPTPLHTEVACDSIEQGCHVLVEKPLADPPEQARLIIDMARSRHVRLAVGHVERFNPAVRKLREIIKEGTLGRVLSLSARRVGLPSPHYQDTNVVVDLAVHDLDVIRYLLGDELRVLSSVTGRLTGGPSEDYADMLLLAGSVPCVIQVNWVTPVKIRTLCVVGDAGYAELNYITQAIELYRRQDIPASANYKELIARFSEPERETIRGDGEEPLKAELKSFFRAIQTGEEPEANGEDGLAAVELAESALGFARQAQVP
ncbi:MAG: Gfo/Idh/MocA family oxidoreductase [Dehalococcoidia bacterium]